VLLQSNHIVSIDENNVGLGPRLTQSRYSRVDSQSFISGRSSATGEGVFRNLNTKNILKGLEKEISELKASIAQEDSDRAQDGHADDGIRRSEIACNSNPEQNESL
jgi:hypothetical protein